MLTTAFRIPLALEAVSSREWNAALTLTELSIPALIKGSHAKI